MFPAPGFSVLFDLKGMLLLIEKIHRYSSWLIWWNFSGKSWIFYENFCCSSWRLWWIFFYKSSTIGSCGIDNIENYSSSLTPIQMQNLLHSFSASMCFQKKTTADVYNLSLPCPRFIPVVEYSVFWLQCSTEVVV